MEFTIKTNNELSKMPFCLPILKSECELEYSSVMGVLIIEAVSLSDETKDGWDYAIVLEIDTIDFLKSVGYDIDYKSTSINYQNRTSDSIGNYYIDNYPCELEDIEDLIQEEDVYKYLESIGVVVNDNPIASKNIRQSAKEMLLALNKI
ncbi:MAG: hypothetical protein H6552_00680 [Chitinophagales bacterium]|nr:hypothetical protein [Chitinophagales bacterium]